ncbi:MAG TPA: hypothetical protein VIM57_06840 [Luteolibacter sp.]
MFQFFLKITKMRRIRHAAIGMLTGWLTLQVLVLLTMFGSLAIEFARQGRLTGGWYTGVFVFAIFTGCSAVVCLIAWLAFYLPAYWYWPRDDSSWNRNAFTFVGGFSGGLIGLIFVLANAFSAPLPWALAIIAMPAVTGGVGALTGWWREEKERRFLEWQKQVTHPI